MSIGDILTLDYNDKCLVVDKVLYNQENYCLTIGVNKEETDIDINDIKFYKEIDENGNYFLEEVVDKDLLDELIDKDEINNLNKLDNLQRVLEDYYKSN